MAESTLASDIHSPSPPASQLYRTILPATYLLDLPDMDTALRFPGLLGSFILLFHFMDERGEERKAIFKGLPWNKA